MNGFLFRTTLFSLLISLAGYSAAKEPVNLATVKHQVIQYHDSGEYDQDVKTVMAQALSYLKTRVNQPYPAGKKPAIILDIDETSLSNYPDMAKLDFGGSINDIRQMEDKGTDPVIQPTLELYQFAKAHHVAVFFITGRHEEEREATKVNLQKVGYNEWEELILRDGPYKTVPAAVYKTAKRKEITAKGYDIILNIGDQNSDLAGGYADKTFKLPNPYYFIP